MNANSPQGWSSELREEAKQGHANGRVGTKLLSENSRVRIWQIRLKPGERLPFHCHVLDYFWTAVTAGQACSRSIDGSISRRTYKPGDIEHFQYAHNDCKIHDLTNVGDTELGFVTVEFLDSANQSLVLTVGDAIR
jgi:quercetin dioxygenase-like cupin family protein